MAGSDKNKKDNASSGFKRQVERSPLTQSMPNNKKSSRIDFGNSQAGKKSLHDI